MACLRWCKCCIFWPEFGCLALQKLVEKCFFIIFCTKKLDKGGKFDLGFEFLIFLRDHLIRHLELHVQALRCGWLPSSLSGSVPAIFEPYATGRGRVSAIGMCVRILHVGFLWLGFLWVWKRWRYLFWTNSQARIRTADLWPTKLTCYQLNCPAWIHGEIVQTRLSVHK